jgi:2-polyprenyl-6-methoxyphenol hydroxylase-like FAD-dependent oxidoreductase
MLVYAFSDHQPTVLLSYRTDDVDAEFTESPAERVRAVYGTEPLGSTLADVVAAMESADDLLFDSVEQAHMDSWHRGRVVLVGDAAWCPCLYSGMGASAAMAGADFLGTVLQRHPDDIERALTEWERSLRPSMDYYQEYGIKQRPFSRNNEAELVRKTWSTSEPTGTRGSATAPSAARCAVADSPDTASVHSTVDGRGISA